MAHGGRGEAGSGEGTMPMEEKAEPAEDSFFTRMSQLEQRCALIRQRPFALSPALSQHAEAAAGSAPIGLAASSTSAPRQDIGNIVSASSSAVMPSPLGSNAPLSSQATASVTTAPAVSPAKSTSSKLAFAVVEAERGLVARQAAEAEAQLREAAPCQRMHLRASPGAANGSAVPNAVTSEDPLAEDRRVVERLANSFNSCVATAGAREQRGPGSPQPEKESWDGPVAEFLSNSAAAPCTASASERPLASSSLNLTGSLCDTWDCKSWDNATGADVPPTCLAELRAEVEAADERACAAEARARAAEAKVVAASGAEAETRTQLRAAEGQLLQVEALCAQLQSRMDQWSQAVADAQEEMSELALVLTPDSSSTSPGFQPDSCESRASDIPAAVVAMAGAIRSLRKKNMALEQHVCEAERRAQEATEALACRTRECQVLHAELLEAQVPQVPFCATQEEISEAPSLGCLDGVCAISEDFEEAGGTGGSPQRRLASEVAAWQPQLDMDQEQLQPERSKQINSRSGMVIPTHCSTALERELIHERAVRAQERARQALARLAQDDFSSLGAHLSTDCGQQHQGAVVGPSPPQLAQPFPVPLPMSKSLAHAQQYQQAQQQAQQQSQQPAPQQSQLALQSQSQQQAPLWQQPQPHQHRRAALADVKAVATPCANLRRPQPSTPKPNLKLNLPPASPVSAQVGQRRPQAQGADCQMLEPCTLAASSGSMASSKDHHQSPSSSRSAQFGLSPQAPKGAVPFSPHQSMAMSGSQVSPVMLPARSPPPPQRTTQAAAQPQLSSVASAPGDCRRPLVSNYPRSLAAPGTPPQKSPKSNITRLLFSGGLASTASPNVAPSRGTPSRPQAQQPQSPRVGGVPAVSCAGSLNHKFQPALNSSPLHSHDLRSFLPSSASSMQGSTRTVSISGEHHTGDPLTRALEELRMAKTEAASCSGSATAAAGR